MNQQRSAVNMISGGVDSVATAYYVKKELRPSKQLLIFCNYKQRTYDYEEFCIKQISKALKVPLKIIDLKWLGDISTSVLTHPERPISETKEVDLWNPDKARQRILKWWDPCRNAVLLLVGLSHAESFYISDGERYDVYIGIRRETPVAMKDNTTEFLDEMNRLGEQATHHGGYKLLAPLITYDKDKVVELGEKLGVPWEYTYSCYSGHGFRVVKGRKLPVHCGVCSNCRRRKVAFRDAGVKDPSVYAK
ncbi:MAG: 7-cyano-7-deazaguanine synthase [Nitrososphaerota archaeon]|jgi:7-cyano-7-deazaguanine synthase|nr:7-cyano-7-deazaguanine synthase [Nitrososphaerota archaeon]MDG6903774.1 7-cyano-7-deazaguanine synthase [Nitrososphaerota archaeon]MDG6911593.1 7-cyano-7-deazaguanine synthase [Nitrososphaerota archaeon]MDG6940497.1 7-cyano-7-deazaguanine synthase [Nitrososphaerota archaeon]MDG6960808.1 7-cyano-7-deazaguanine synthase [Nitrososphaerota archaeon]